MSGDAARKSACATVALATQDRIATSGARRIGIFRRAPRWAGFLIFAGKVLALAIWITFVGAILWWVYYYS